MVSTLIEHDNTTKHYDSDTGSWTGQLAVPGMPEPEPVERKTGGPVERKPGGPLDRFTWMKPATRELTGAGFKFVFALAGYSNDQGRCYPSHARLRLDTGLSDSGLRKGQREAVNTGWVVVEESGKGKASSHYRLTGADTGWVRVSPEEHPGCHQRNTQGCHQSNDRTLSSSNPKINPEYVIGCPEKGPEPDGVTDGVFKFSSLEEERTGTGAEPGTQPTPEPSKPTDPTVSAPPPVSDLEEARAFVDGVLSEIPTDSEIEGLGKHCWREWSKHCWREWSKHWGGGWAAAWSTWTKDTAGRKKFKADAPMHLAQVGLPQLQEPNVEDQAARERLRVEGDRNMAELQAVRRTMKLCAGCGKRRDLQPNETHCYLCHQEVVEIAA